MNRFGQIKNMVETGTISETAINDKVRKILQAKSWLGLDTLQTKIDQSLAFDIMSNGFDGFEIRQLFEKGLTLVNNPVERIPFVQTYRAPFRVVNIGDAELESFQQYFSKYASYSLINQPLTATGSYEPLNQKRLNGAQVILTLSNINLDTQSDSALIVCKGQ